MTERISNIPEPDKDYWIFVEEAHCMGIVEMDKGDGIGFVVIDRHDCHHKLAFKASDLRQMLLEYEQHLDKHLMKKGLA